MVLALKTFKPYLYKAKDVLQKAQNSLSNVSQFFVNNLESLFLTAPSSIADKKPFVCNFCRKEFGHLSSLESHMDHMHSGDSKHNCEACGKSFSSKSNLTAHRKIHSGEFLYFIVCFGLFGSKFLCHVRFHIILIFINSPQSSLFPLLLNSIFHSFIFIPPSFPSPSYLSLLKSSYPRQFLL